MYLSYFEINLKNNFKKIQVGVARNKIIFIVLVLAFIALSVYFFGGEFWVKGDSRGAFYAVVWIDNERMLLRSTSINRDEILSENNIIVYPEDKVTTELILDPVTDGGAGQKIIIKRAPVYHLLADGKTIDIRTWDSAVSAVIEKSALPLSPKDIVSPSKEEKITPGTTIVVTRINEADIEITEDIPFNIVRKGDPGVPFGQDKVSQAGVTGKLVKTYRVTYKNRVEVARRFIKKTTTVSKKDKIIASGVVLGRANFGYYTGMVTSFYKSGYQGRYLLVTNLSNGKQVKVKIIGAGPFNGPILDMGTEPFQAIGGRISDGFIPSVSVQLVD